MSLIVICYTAYIIFLSLLLEVQAQNIFIFACSSSFLGVFMNCFMYFHASLNIIKQHQTQPRGEITNEGTVTKAKKRKL